MPGSHIGTATISQHRTSTYIFRCCERANAAAFKFRISAFMLNEVYNRRILELAGSIPRLGRLATPDASATAHSKLCGSTVTVDLQMDGDPATDFAHQGKACAPGQASSPVLAA